MPNTMTRRSFVGRVSAAVGGFFLASSVGLGPYNPQALAGTGCNGLGTSGCVGPTTDYVEFGGNCPSSSCIRKEDYAGPGEVCNVVNGGFWATCVVTGWARKGLASTCNSFTRSNYKCYGNYAHF